MRSTFVESLIKITKNDKNIFLITGDLGFGVLKPFWELFPDQFLNLGIAEQNMIGFATGMALEGKTVFTYSIGNFPTMRCLEQIRNDCAYHNANVKIVAVGGGFEYGALGMSHHATEDISIMRAMPNVTVLAPADTLETEYATYSVYRNPGTHYLRLGRVSNQYHSRKLDFVIGKAYKILEGGSEIAFFCTGAILDEVIKASTILSANNNIFPTIYSFPTIKPLDIELIYDCVSTYNHIITVEEHNLAGGFGSAIAEVIIEIPNRKSTFSRIGINDQFSKVVGSQDYLRRKYHISSDSIVDKVLRVVE